MLRKPAHLILYCKYVTETGFCNVLKYKVDTFYLSLIQKPAPVLSPSSNTEVFSGVCK